MKCLFAIDAIAGVYRCVTNLKSDLGAPCRNWLSDPPTDLQRANSWRSARKSGMIAAALNGMMPPPIPR